ncbi:ribosome-associated translation inhibitor RaiA [Ferruginibacter paludis]|jgi:putative sigma-54 modulation protein|uniref:ribosome hibernation-promoting factor, HPF/YfiA family n=1 Tax=Ferruginibacter paludis TaxID=1310417 RepID=UPI0025B3E6EF|nr:ribosome-associated translation inhibitor RaiA [Ferruginibacter paludis]MDN3656585.1 ribosome-associated translation inhibitor RaiA [Ferruginibacter paludis]
MELTIESPGLQTDANLESLIQSKFNDLKNIYSRITNSLVVLRKENDDRKKYFHVEAQVAVPQKTLFANDKAETFEIALHKVMEDLEHQLHRYKEERNHFR